MASPAGQPAPASTLLADRHRPRNGHPADGHNDQPADSDADGNQPEVPPGTPEPRPSGTPT
jgi:hypothetical protein